MNMFRTCLTLVVLAFSYPGICEADGPEPSTLRRTADTTEAVAEQFVDTNQPQILGDWFGGSSGKNVPSVALGTVLGATVLGTVHA